MKFSGNCYVRNEEFDDYTIIGEHFSIADQIDFEYDILEQLQEYAKDWELDSKYEYYVYFEGTFDGMSVTTMDGTEYEVDIEVEYCSFSIFE